MSNSCPNGRHEADGLLTGVDAHQSEAEADVGWISAGCEVRVGLDAAATKRVGPPERPVPKGPVRVVVHVELAAVKPIKCGQCVGEVHAGESEVLCTGQLNKATLAVPLCQGMHVDEVTAAARPNRASVLSAAISSSPIAGPRGVCCTGHSRAS